MVSRPFELIIDSRGLFTGEGTWRINLTLSVPVLRLRDQFISILHYRLLSVMVASYYLDSVVTGVELV